MFRASLDGIASWEIRVFRTTFFNWTAATSSRSSQRVGSPYGFKFHEHVLVTSATVAANEESVRYAESRFDWLLAPNHSEIFLSIIIILQRKVLGKLRQALN